MASDPCVCPASGWCERHQRSKHQRHWQLCQGINCTPAQSEKRRELWDQKADIPSSAKPISVTPLSAVLPSVTVAIICHNYGRFLRECVESVRAQTVAALEVFVIDDASTDETAVICEELGVERIYVEHRNIHENRCLAYRRSRGDVLCFLDADDVLPPDYLAAGLPLFRDVSVAIIFSDMERFGEVNAVTNYPPAATFQTIEFDNVIHAGSLVRRDVLELTEAMGLPMSQSAAHADWMIWKRVLRKDWKAIKQSAVYRYRQHGANMHPTETSKPYYERANLRECPLTLFVPLSGREQYWPDMLANVKQIVACENPISVIFCDTSKSETFGAQVRSDLQQADLPDVRYVTLDVGTPGRADQDRADQDICQDVNRACATIYNWLQKHVSTEFVLILEDDVFPNAPASLVRDLLTGFDHITNAVSGVYINRQVGDRYVAFRERGGMIPLGWEGTGIEQIWGSGFGCLMLRTSILKSVPITCRVLPWEAANVAYDLSFFQRLEPVRGVCKINWDVLCRHAEIDCHKPEKPLPRDEWPTPAKLIASLATNEDRGVGDTIKRVIGKVGVIYQTAFKLLTGSSCKSCGFRQTKWNQLYPYS